MSLSARVRGRPIRRYTALRKYKGGGRTCPSERREIRIKESLHPSHIGDSPDRDKQRGIVDARLQSRVMTGTPHSWVVLIEDGSANGKSAATRGPKSRDNAGRVRPAHRNEPNRDLSN